MFTDFDYILVLILSYSICSNSSIWQVENGCFMQAASFFKIVRYLLQFDRILPTRSHPCFTRRNQRSKDV